MTPLSVRTLLTKAAQDYKKNVRFYAAPGLALTILFWLLKLATEYAAVKSGYSAVVLYKELPPFETVSAGAIFFKEAFVVYVKQVIALSPVWIGVMLCLVLLAKVCKMLIELFVYTISVVVSAGRPLNDGSVKQSIMQTKTHFWRYVGATLLFGILVAALLISWIAPIVLISSFNSMQNPLIILIPLLVIALVGAFITLRYATRWYLYPYCLINQELTVRQSLQESSRLLASCWKKVVVILVVLYVPLSGLCALSSFLLGTMSIVNALLCGYLTIGVFFPFVSLVFARLYKSLL